MSESSSRRLLTIALDGATWDMLDGWIAEGKLPNLARLIAGGVSAPLESTIPPITTVAWLTFATSKNPARHGVFDFFRPIRQCYTDLVPATADLNRQSTLWGILSRRGRRVGVVNVPMTFPPEPVNGFIIPGAPAPACDDPGYPPGLVDELRRHGWDLTRDATLAQGSFDEMLCHLKDLVRARTEATCYLLGHQPWDFFMVHFLETDQVQHTFWRFLEKADSPFRDAILHLYEEVDRGIGQILDTAGDVPVVLMSDHGMGPTRYHVNLNNWLVQEGFMRWQRRPATALRRLGYRLGINPTRLYNALPPKLLRRLTLGDLRTGVAQIPTEHVGHRRSLTQRLFELLSHGLFLSFNDVDWSRTAAYSTGTTGAGLIYLNLSEREPAGIVSGGAEYRRVREQIAQRLMNFTDPWTHRPLVKRVYRREELYQGPHITDAPDLIAIYRYGEYDHKKGTVFLSSRPVEPVRDANATHRPYGIFALYAPGVAQSGERLDAVHIQDVAPTILHLMGEAVPRELEGQVLETGLTDDYSAAHPVQISEEPTIGPATDQELSSSELEIVLERLHDLGYIV